MTIKRIGMAQAFLMDGLQPVDGFEVAFFYK